MGQSPPSQYYNHERIGVPFLQGIRTFGDKYPKYDTWVTKPQKMAKQGDVLFSVRAPVGQVNIAPSDVCIGRGLASISGDNNEFIYYLLKTCGQRVIDRQTGTVFGAVGKESLEYTKFHIPPRDEQKDIAKILSDLDSKIELNEKMNRTLEDIAQAIFKHWFIDFEFPNEEGKPYKSSGGEMVDSELGKIPKGWEVKTLTDVGSLKNGINYTRNEEWNTEFFIVNVRNIVNQKFILRSDLDKIKLNSTKFEDYQIKQNDIVIARSGSPGESSFILENTDNILYSGFSIRYRLNNPDNSFYMFFLLQNYKHKLLMVSIGTVIRSINQNSLRSISFVMPSDSIIRKFTSISIISRLKYNLLESKTLSNIRDSLLPKLMTGKIRVPLEDEHE